MNYLNQIIAALVTITGFLLVSLGSWGISIQFIRTVSNQQNIVFTSLKCMIPMAILEFIWTLTFLHSNNHHSKSATYILSLAAGVIGSFLSIYIHFDEIPSIPATLGISLVILGAIIVTVYR